MEESLPLSIWICDNATEKLYNRIEWLAIKFPAGPLSISKSNASLFYNTVPLDGLLRSQISSGFPPRPNLTMSLLPAGIIFRLVIFLSNKAALTLYNFVTSGLSPLSFTWLFAAPWHWQLFYFQCYRPRIQHCPASIFSERISVVSNEAPLPEYWLHHSHALIEFQTNDEKPANYWQV